jgi:hypothetical protein
MTMKNSNKIINKNFGFWLYKDLLLNAIRTIKTNSCFIINDVIYFNSSFEKEYKNDLLFLTDKERNEIQKIIETNKPFAKEIVKKLLKEQNVNTNNKS